MLRSETMAHGHDVDRFNRWATTYDRHWMQRIIFDPIQRTVLQVAAEQVGSPGAILDVGCGTGKLLKSARARFPGARLVGVDAASEMVRYALSTTPDDNIEFRQATAEAAVSGRFVRPCVQHDDVSPLAKPGPRRRRGGQGLGSWRSLAARRLRGIRFHETGPRLAETPSVPRPHPPPVDA